MTAQEPAQPPPQHASDVPAQPRDAAGAPLPEPVRHLLRTLSLNEKAGQLFVLWSLTREHGQQQARERLLHAVREVGLGGVVLSLGSVDEAARFVPELQAAATVPLLLAGDFECGLGFRLDGATEMGNQMLVGATGLARLARAVGEVTGREGKALGFHWVFAPVLDVNSNPQNPIINVRSFGEDPALVARLGAAVAAGIRAQGLIPCGKHFPGHGDVQTDSHLALATVPGDAQRLHRVELLPFRVASGEGLESVMTGHLAVPGLGEDADVPATLSRHILGDVLRRELGFAGLVVTDSLGMGGVKTDAPREEIAVRALLAGCDVLLMPPDPVAARDAVVAAVEQGRVSRERLDEAVGRILAIKHRVGLLGGAGGAAPRAGGVDPRWREIVGSAAAVGEEIAARGITLVTDREGLVPLRGFGDALLVELYDRRHDEDERAGVLELPVGETVRLFVDSPPPDVDAVVARLHEVPRVVLALHVRVREFSGTIGLPPTLRPVIEALRPEQQVVAVSFGNPYLGTQLQPADAYLCAYGSSALVERAAAHALRGEAAITGRLPVTIPGVAAIGTGRTRLCGTDVPRADPASEGLDPALPATIEALLAQAVADRVFPGAVCLVARRGRLVAEVAVGRHSYEPDAEPVTPATPFDLASLTKVCATTPAVLRLCAAGRLSLDDPVQRWVPAFRGGGKERVTVRHLLAHTSGLPAYERFWLTVRGRDAIVAAAAATPLQAAPGERFVYSDLGLILLFAVAESCSGEPFATFVQREVFAPLGMQHARFWPVDGPAAPAPPTEVDAARGGLVRGRVHDENAFAMGGVSGHAGLFAPAADVLRIGLCFLGGGRGVLPSRLTQLATAPATDVGATTRGLGVELLQPGGWGGTAPPPGTFGHTGFTGTSLWCDPTTDTCVVLLTNRVHPTRDNPRILDVRRKLHDFLASP